MEVEIEGKQKIKRHLGLLQSVSVIVGIIIGSGIFISPVGILMHVRSIGLSLIVWAGTGVFSIIGALCFAELGTTIPRSGGEYIYIKTAFGDFFGFLILWTELFIISALPFAVSAQIFAVYVLKPVLEPCEPSDLVLKLIGVLILSLVAFINSVNVRAAAKVQVVFMLCKLVALAIIIVIGVVHMFQGYSTNLQNVFEDSDYSLGALALAFYSGFWAYGGWNYLNFLSEEIINPNRNLPLAIVISIGLITGVYLLANVAYAAVLTPAELLSSNAVAFTFADRKMGPVSWIMPLFVAASVFGSINGGYMSISRIFMVGAEEKQMPEIVAMVNVRFETPLPALLLVFVVTVMFLVFADIFYLIELLGFSFAIILTMTMLAQMYMRYKYPHWERPIRLPIVVPLFLCVWSVLLIVMTVYQKPQKSLIGLAIILLAIPVYYIFVVWKNKPKAMQRSITRIMHVLQKVLHVANVEHTTLHSE